MPIINNDATHNIRKDLRVNACDLVKNGYSMLMTEEEDSNSKNEE